MRAKITKYVAEIVEDPYGNMIARKGKPHKPRILLAAHMDEVGFMITGIEKSGRLRFHAIGMMPAVLMAKRVLIGKDKVPGVIGHKPIHLAKQEEMKKLPDMKDLFIDIGASSKEEARDVGKGDYIYFRSAFIAQGGLCFGKAFDDRVGCAALSTLLCRYGEDKPRVSVSAVYTAQEEVGLRGAWTAALDREGIIFNLNLEGTTCADRDMEKTYSPSTELGKGPAITVMDKTMITNRRLLDWTLGIARARSIPYQLKQTVTGGTDAGRIHLSGEGIPSITVSVPIRYIHAPWGILSRKDFENYIRLAAAIVEEAHRFKT